VQPKATPEDNETASAKAASELWGSTLADLRSEIDRIDAAMHELLIERGRVIDRLVDIKRQQGGGSAFRPAREASMMRAIVDRHRGLLPLDTVEGIWRIIISTFTYIQAAYKVHIDVSYAQTSVRDSARFNFGFTVPCVPHASASEVIAAVAASENDLGMLVVGGSAAAGAWWTQLVPTEAPKVIARLPFVERSDHPAGIPVFIVSKPLAEGLVREIVLEAIALDKWRPSFERALRTLDAEIVGSGPAEIGLSLLIARGGAIGPNLVSRALRDAGAADVHSVEIGAHADRFNAGALRGRILQG
jgi:chorismate mutase